MSAANVSVVIRCYTEERWDSLVEAVRSSQTQSQKPLEVVVVVDHNPALASRARHALASAVIVENEGPRGSAGAWNRGIAASQGEIIAFLDDDAAAAPDWLEQLTAEYKHHDVAGVGGAIEPVWQGGRPDWFPSEFDWVVGCTYSGMPREAAPVRNLIGCNMSFRRQVFEIIGGFRNGIGHVGGQPFGCDETELCIRLRQHWPRAVLRYTPLARVYHQVPESRARWSYFRSRCAMEGRSKALVAGIVGAKDGTSTERAYVLKTLPSGVARGLHELLRGESSGLSRAGAIVAGLAITVAGYAEGRLAQHRDTPIPVIGSGEAAAASMRAAAASMRDGAEAM